MTITGEARLAGVFGWPIAHSLSPRLHGHWLARYGIDGAYVPLATPPERFEQALLALPALGFRGANVTIPHKERALQLCDVVDPAASRIGAVNTVVVRDGQLHGSNTDGFGFLENLRGGAPSWRLENSPAVILGAGGAARAIVVALLDAGVPELRLVNRTRARADALREELGGAVVCRDWEDRELALGDAGLLVNTTSLGMPGQDPLALSLDKLPEDALVTDIVYKPLVTPLLDAAQQRGLATVDGLGMLLHQARPGFEAWFGHQPEVDDALRAAVLAD